MSTTPAARSGRRHAHRAPQREVAAAHDDDGGVGDLEQRVERRRARAHRRRRPSARGCVAQRDGERGARLRRDVGEVARGPPAAASTPCATCEPEPVERVGRARRRRRAASRAVPWAGRPRARAPPAGRRRDRRADRRRCRGRAQRGRGREHRGSGAALRRPETDEHDPSRASETRRHRGACRKSRRTCECNVPPEDGRTRDTPGKGGGSPDKVWPRPYASRGARLLRY